ncbi:MAG TPA: hypothetical protein DEB74_18450 [Lachnospiraceae bacterium]|nr:hypothetical protein [Lachnospiraceae bacterium]
MKELNNLIDCICGHYKPGITYTAKVHNDLYFIATDCNALFSISLLTGDIKLITVFENENLYGYFLGNAFTYGRYVVVCPFNYYQIHIWDTKKNQEKNIKKARSSNFNYEIGLYRMISIREKLLFFPSISHDVVVLNANTGEIENKISVFDSFLHYNENGYNVFSRDLGYIYNGKIYFSMSDINFIAEYDIRLNMFLFYELDLDEQIILSDGIEDSLYMLDVKGQIYEWNINTHAVTKKANIKCEGYDITWLQSTLKYGDFLYYMSPNNTFGIKYNFIENILTIESYCNLFNIENDEEEYHFSLFDEDKNIYFISEQYNLVIYDLKNCQYKKLCLNIKDSELEQLKQYQNSRVQKFNIGELIYKSI